MKTKQMGAALIELALILPLFLLLTFITTEFGRAIYQYNTITKSVRDAVRYLSVQTPGTHFNEAKNLVVYGNPSPEDTETPLALGLQLAHVEDPVWQIAGTNPVINTVTITVSGYRFTPLLANVFGIAFSNAEGEIPFGSISATMRAPL